jgi:hypothetical protein
MGWLGAWGDSCRHSFGRPAANLPAPPARYRVRGQSQSQGWVKVKNEVKVKVKNEVKVKVKNEVKVKVRIGGL